MMNIVLHEVEFVYIFFFFTFTLIQFAKLFVNLIFVDDPQTHLRDPPVVSTLVLQVCNIVLVIVRDPVDLGLVAVVTSTLLCD